jgi:hypothetical protein
MTVMRNLLKLFVVLLIINGALMTVQATDSGALPIKATLEPIFSIEVKTTDLSWTLDPAINPLIDNIAKEEGIFVSTNEEDAWTVDVSGKPLNAGGNSLAFMTLTPSEQDWGDVKEVYMKEPGTMWTAKGKGVNSIALGFSQPTSWDDIPSSDYGTILTFTLSH